MAWLLDQVPSHWRQDTFLRAQPVLLARRVVEQLTADVDAARAAWVPLEQWLRADLPLEAHDGVRQMLALEGPALAARRHAAELVRDALATGRRWRPLL